jgi:hypothetical protein
VSSGVTASPSEGEREAAMTPNKGFLLIDRAAETSFFPVVDEKTTKEMEKGKI